jgi:hypothetical protein
MNLITELNLLSTIPLHWLMGLIALFILALTRLSFTNVLFFLFIYVLVTRVHQHIYAFCYMPKPEKSLITGIGKIDELSAL